MSEQPEGGRVHRVRVRRAPRYGAFLATGAGLGVVLALIGALSGPGADIGRGRLVGFLAMLLGLLGALLGGLIAVVVERLGRQPER